MKVTVTLNKVEEQMLNTLKEHKLAEGKTTEECAENFFHNHLWIVYDMYFKEKQKKEKEVN